MPVDTFTREQFEAALPRNKQTQAQLWKADGLVDGEYEYTVRISEHVVIKIRSSVKYNGVSGECGKDSIRLWLADPTTGKPMGNKLNRHTTRVNGWQLRMTEALRELWRMGSKVTVCPTCGKAVVKVFKVKKDGPNKGRTFLKCMVEPKVGEQKCDYFEWLS